MKNNRLQAAATRLNKELKHLKKNHYLRIDYSEHPFDWIIIMFSTTRESDWPDGKISNTEYIKLALYPVNRKGYQLTKYAGYNLFTLDPINSNIDDTLAHRKTYEIDLMVLYIVTSLNDISQGKYFRF
jgi:hypothetical protein